MASETSFLRAILPSLPDELSEYIQTLCDTSSDAAIEKTLETLIRFVAGAECGPNASPTVHAQWSEKQQATFTKINGLLGKSASNKRQRLEEEAPNGSQASKRQKSSGVSISDAELASDEAVITLGPLSVTSPVRKKVNIAIYRNSIRFINPTNNATEATMPLSVLSRAFIVPTRGKTKAHWTVILLPKDTSDRGNKEANASAANQQVIFGTDAKTTTPLTITDHSISNSTLEPMTINKGTEIYNTLKSFLAKLEPAIKLVEPTPDVFKSACGGITTGVNARDDGIPGVEAYRGAKVGSLWFSRDGILWGESKPCEFWPVDEFIPKSEAVRVVGGASGQRTLTIVLTRKGATESGAEEGDMDIESEFGMVDARERMAIEGWTRAHRHLFGKKQAPVSKTGSAAPILVPEDSDEEDENFQPDSDSDGGSATGSSEEESGDEAEASSVDEDAEGEDDDDDVEDLKPEHHPLLQPGAMPKMNHGIIDMVAGMVEEDMMDEQGADMEQDELDD